MNHAMDVQAIRNRLQRSLPLPAYHALRVADHACRGLLRLPDPGWEFYSFEQSFHPAVRGRRHRQLVAWAQRMADSAAGAVQQTGERPVDPVTSQGLALRAETLSRFRDSLARRNLRVMVHLPDERDSPGVWSALNSFVQSLAFLGVAVERLRADDLARQLTQFAPTLFLSGDHPTFRQHLDWDALGAHRRTRDFAVGLYTGPEPYDPRCNSDNARWARSVGATFFYSFRDPAYVHDSAAYAPYHDAGFEFLFLPFGANVLHYHPVEGVQRDVPFVFLASQNPSKYERYRRFMQTILAQHGGFVDGPGWRHARGFRFDPARDRYLYARARTGLNIHLDEQIATACEVNERTYQLAACGVPQVIDRPALLPRVFSADALFVADSPDEYVRQFECALGDAAQARSRALKAQAEVFASHTTFHRAADFVTQLARRGICDA